MTNLNFDRSPQKLKTPETKISKTPLPQKIKPHFPHHTPLFTLKIKEYAFISLFKKPLKPSLRSVCQRIWLQRSKIHNLNSVIRLHPLFSITTKPPQNSKRGCTCLFLRNFAFLSTLVKPSILTTYHRKSELDYAFLPIKIKSAHSPFTYPTHF